jgi:hypothetical protein
MVARKKDSEKADRWEEKGKKDSCEREERMVVKDQPS